MTEDHPEKGTRDNPLTQRDVLEAIENNGGKAEGLDLSGKWFEDHIDLSDRDLSGINLNNAHLFRANFNGSTLDGAEFHGARLGHAAFNPLNDKPVSLSGARFGGAHLGNAEFQHARRVGARFRRPPGYLGET